MIEYERGIDDYGRRVTRMLAWLTVATLIAAAARTAWPVGFDLHVAVRPLNSGSVWTHLIQVLTLTGLPLVAALLADLLLLPLLMGSRIGHLRFERDLGSATPESCAARLLEIGYRLDGDRLRSPRYSALAAIFMSRMTHGPHTVELRDSRATLRFENVHTDTGESEFARCVLDYIVSDAPALRLRRTSAGFQTFPLACAVAGTAMTFASGGAAAAAWLTTIALGYVAFALPHVWFQRRWLFGYRFLLLALAVAGANALLLLR